MMSSPEDKRTSKRIPFSSRVKVAAKGRTAFYAVAINLSLGGILLSASPAPAVGTRCVVSLPSGGVAGKAVRAEGTVVRTGDQGFAIQFQTPLETRNYDRIAGQPTHSVFNSYLAYFKVSQSENYAGCDSNFGVSPRTFRRVFLTTFYTSIPAAILPVFVFRGSLPPLPIWENVALSFGYGAFWLFVIQPSVDLAVFRTIRKMGGRGSEA